jgi:hypothetical protein
MNTHVARICISILAAILISLLLSTFGAHGVLGWIAVYIGYVGGVANWKLNPGRVSYTFIAVVNAVVYFLILEAAFTAKRRISN